MRSFAILCLGLAACTPSASEVAAASDRAADNQARLDRELAGYVAGPPQDCLSGIDRRISDGSRTIGGTLLYRVRSNEIIRNDMNGNCDFSRDPILVTSTPSTQVCRGDIVQLIDRAARFPIGSCAYGDFVTYTKAAR